MILAEVTGNINAILKKTFILINITVHSRWMYRNLCLQACRYYRQLTYTHLCLTWRTCVWLQHRTYWWRAGRPAALILSDKSHSWRKKNNLQIPGYRNNFICKLWTYQMLQRAVQKDLMKVLQMSERHRSAMANIVLGGHKFESDKPRLIWCLFIVRYNTSKCTNGHQLYLI